MTTMKKSWRSCRLSNPVNSDRSTRTRKRWRVDRAYAEKTLNKNKRVNIRLSEKDLEEIKIRALEEGIPYQTLMGSVLHKYLSGRLVEKTIERAV